MAVEKFVLPEDVTKEALLQVIDDINANDKIHGVLLFRPLPGHLKADQDEICNRLDPPEGRGRHDRPLQRRYFYGQGTGVRPLHSAACMEILDHYGIDCTGKKAVVIGRSLVVGEAGGHDAHGEKRHCHRLPHPAPRMYPPWPGRRIS